MSGQPSDKGEELQEICWSDEEEVDTGQNSKVLMVSGSTFKTCVQIGQ